MEKQTKRQGAKKESKKILVKVVFWLGFIIFILILFLSSWKSIQSSLKNTGVLDLLLNHTPSTKTPASLKPVGISSPIEVTPVEDESTPFESFVNDGAPVAEISAALPETSFRTSQPPQKPNETYQDRPIYMIQVDRDGFILRIRVNRNLPASDAPLRDVLQVLLNGPSIEEQGRGLISLIPPGTRLLGTTIQGNTARINFSEEFLFNTFGIEGYANSLLQVVWTATEFPNVKDVQFLIEGHVVNYLGESIQINRPIGRKSL